MTIIEGLDDLTAFLKEHPKELNKSAIQSLMKGANVLKKEIVNQMPTAIKALKPIVTTKKLGKEDNPTLLVGIFGKKMFYVNHRGIQWDSFYLVYWNNYGTLASRDSGHQFVFGRRRPSTNWRGGIKPSRFFDRAVDASFDEALNTASDDLNDIIDQLATKYNFQ